MLFLMPDQQYQSTEGKFDILECFDLSFRYERDVGYWHGMTSLLLIAVKKLLNSNGLWHSVSGISSSTPVQLYFITISTTLTLVL